MGRISLATWVGREIVPHERDLRLWLRRMLHHGADVEDVIQECYCYLATMMDVESIREPRAFLFTMARNYALKQLRRNKIVSIGALTVGAMADDADDVQSPERILAARQTLRMLDAAIAALPERSRLIFRMRRIDELSQREVARRLGVSENVVENEMSRGVRMVIKRLRAAEAVPPEAQNGVGHERVRARG